MNVNTIENLGSTTAAQTNASKSQEAMRRAAAQFEAVLLAQLTSALNGTNNEDEESLFGSDGGSGLAKQMFSEQLATTMADSGGIGLSDVIMRQFGAEQPKTSGIANKLANLISTVKEIKGNNKANTSADSTIAPLTNTSLGDPNDTQIISTAEDEIKAYGLDDSLKSLELDGKVVNTTRARLVPNSAVTESQPVSAAANSVVLPPVTMERMDFQMPVIGRISSDFGNRFHPIDKKIKFHAGLDIAAPKGTSIGAAAEGVVTFAGWKKGYGNMVIIRHPDGRETRYGHAEKLFVSQGDTVSSGQLIAAVGSTGKSTGPHLHFEVREDGQAVNPLNFLSNVLSKDADK